MDWIEDHWIELIVVVIWKFEKEKREVRILLSCWDGIDSSVESQMCWIGLWGYWDKNSFLAIWNLIIACEQLFF